MKLLSLLLVFTLTSCSSIKNMMKQAKINKEMYQRVASYEYPLNVEALQKAVEADINNKDKGWVASSHVTPNTFEQQNKVKEQLEDGVSYKEKLYVAQSFDLGLGDLTGGAEALKDKIVKSAEKKEYFVLESTKKKFIILNSDQVYIGERVGKNKSKLSVKTIYKVKRKPWQVDFDYVGIAKNLFTGKGNIFSVSQGPISFEKSVKHSVINRDKTVQLYKAIRPEEAKKMETEISKSL